MHGGRHQIEGVAHTDDIRIGHIRPQHGIVDLHAVTGGHGYLGRQLPQATSPHDHRHQQ